MAAWDVTTSNSAFEFDTQTGTYHSSATIDEGHAINFFLGGAATTDGFAQVFAIDTSTWAITTAGAIKLFDTDVGSYNDCIKVDTNHFLNFWQGSAADGFVQAFIVDTTTWAVTTGARIEFDTGSCLHNTCCQIDVNHFLNCWQGVSGDGFVQVFAVNTTTWAVTTSAARLEHDTQNYATGDCCMIDTNHAIVFFSGGTATMDVHAQVFTINTTTWAVTTASARFLVEATNQTVSYNNCAPVDANHVIDFWTNGTSQGNVQIFEINTTTWAVTTAGAVLTYETQTHLFNKATKIDTNHFLQVWRGGAFPYHINAQVIEVNTTTWAVTTAGGILDVVTVNEGNFLTVTQLDANHFIIFWNDVDGDGRSQVIEVELPGGGGTDYDTTLTDAVTIVDTIIKSTSRTLTDAVAMVDSIIKAGTRILVDVVTLVDTITIQKTLVRTYEEVVTIADTILKQTERTLTEAVVLVDTILKQTTKILTDPITMDDVLAIQKTLARTYEETITLVDTIVKHTARTLTDAVVAVDNFTQVMTAKMLTETITLVDTITKQTERTFTEVVEIVDSILRQTYKVLTDPIVLVDVMTSARLFLKELTEQITIVDTITKLTNRTLTDAVSLVDTITRQVEKTLTDAVTAVDTIVKSIARTLTDPVALVDTLTKATTRTLSEAVALVDTIIKQGQKTLIDAVTIADSVLKQLSKTLTEAVTLVDTITKAFNKTLTEAVTVVDSVLKQTERTLVDTVTAVDTYLTELYYAITLSEIVTLADTFTSSLFTKVKKGVTIILSYADRAVTVVKGIGSAVLHTRRQDKNVLELNNKDRHTLTTKGDDKSIT